LPRCARDAGTHDPYTAFLGYSQAWCL